MTLKKNEASTSEEQGMPTTAEEIRAVVGQRFAQVARSPDQGQKFPVGPASAKKLGYDRTEFGKYQPAMVVGSSRGGAVAMSINSGDARLVLLCPAWKKWGTARTVKPGTVILHSREDDVVPFADSEELLRNSGLPATALVGVGNDHRLADPEPLRK
jgi:hypothetical protein